MTITPDEVPPDEERLEAVLNSMPEVVPGEEGHFPRHSAAGVAAREMTPPEPDIDVDDEESSRREGNGIDLGTYDFYDGADDTSDVEEDDEYIPGAVGPAIPLTDDDPSAPARVSFFGGSFLKNIFAGCLGGFSSIAFVLAFVVFIFDPVTAPADMPFAMSMGFIGAALVCLFIASNSRIPYALGGLETGSAAVLGLLALDVHTRLIATYPGDPVFPTIAASLIMCGLIAGLVVYFVGKAGLGRWMRFIPHQVVGGLMAGIGVFYLRGVLDTYTDGMPVYERFLALGGLEGSIPWVAALAFGLVLYIALRRLRRFYVFPVLLLAGAGAFYGWMLYSGMDRQVAYEQGWLFQGFDSEYFWEIYNVSFLNKIHWDVVRSVFPFAAALAGLIASMLMLKVTEIETESGFALSLDRELCAVGQANIVASLAGGLSGSLSRGRSLANCSAGAGGPSAAVLAAILCGGALYFIGFAWAYIPRFILYGILVFFGLKLLTRWLVDTWGMFTRKDDYAVLFIIFLLTITQGLMLGMGVGAALAVFVLVSRYGKVDVVKFTLSGATNHSNVDRAPSQLAILNSKGAQVYILRLQGFVFLGAMYALVRHIRERIANSDQMPLKFVILDFRLVNGLDSAVAIGLLQMKRVALENGISLIFTSIPFEVERQLEEGGFSLNEPDGSCRTFVDSDFALEWCEDRILEAEDALQIREKTLPELLAGGFRDSAEINLLMNFLERVEVRKGHYVFRQGDASDAMYFVESGMVNVQLELEGNKILRLKKMGAGTVVGEMGIYTDAPRSASIVAAEDCVLFRLSKKMLETMQAKQPHLVSDVHRFVVNLLAGRVFEANLKVRDLLK
ncbi:MAG: SLC26A/SulP transporter family protein [Desulfovibrio sp.]|uniref:SLC26A/SulP transporter family protein n=1 Tax=Desulfovibrio sp. 7SRBS1 TaxID=3378064 RepID=UPI003B3EB30B